MMSPRVRPFHFSFVSKTKLNQLLTLSITMSVSLASLAQSPSAPQSNSQPNASLASANPVSSTASISVPAGTNIALVLMHPIESRHVHRGDDIYAQTTSPVVAGNVVVIPPGTFVQGKVDKLAQRRGRAELYLQSMSITYPDGYVAPVTGPITLESGDGYALKDPGSGRIIGAIAVPAAGFGLGALIGHAAGGSQTLTNTLPAGCTGPPPGCLTSTIPEMGGSAKDTIIGAGVGGAIGIAASFALFFHTHNFFLDVGTPVDMTLQRPLALDQDQVAASIRDAEQHPVSEQPVAPRPVPPPVTDNGTCYIPGTPGTPGYDIPGTPGVGGSPGTPPIHIPGTPGTPPTPYPCP